MAAAEWSAVVSATTPASRTGTGTGTWTFVKAAVGLVARAGTGSETWIFASSAVGQTPAVEPEEDEMAYNVAQYKALRSLEVPRRVALALADDDQPFKAATVAAPPALTSPADIPASYNEANMQALRDDVANLRTTVNALLTALKAAGTVKSS